MSSEKSDMYGTDGKETQVQTESVLGDVHNCCDRSDKPAQLTASQLRENLGARRADIIVVKY